MPLPTRWWPRLAAATGLGAFLLLERSLRKGHEARDLQRGTFDRGSTAAIGAAFGMAIVAPPVAVLVRRDLVPAWVGWFGVAAMAAGLGVRWWAAATLGSSYTRTLRVREGQRVVDAGPYALVRHPGYAADILMWAGYGVAWTSVAAILLTTLPMAAAYGYRIGGRGADAQRATR